MRADATPLISRDALKPIPSENPVDKEFSQAQSRIRDAHLAAKLNIWYPSGEVEMTTPPELDNDRNRAVLSYLANQSAHSDVDEALGKAVKPLGDVQMFSPERYSYIAVSTKSIIFGFAVGMNTIAFRLDELLRSRGVATGGVVIPGCGPEWVAFTVFRSDWPMVDLEFWARKAYVFAREDQS